MTAHIIVVQNEQPCCLTHLCLCGLELPFHLLFHVPFIAVLLCPFFAHCHSPLAEEKSLFPHRAGDGSRPFMRLRLLMLLCRANLKFNFAWSCDGILVHPMPFGLSDVTPVPTSVFAIVDPILMVTGGCLVTFTHASTVSILRWLVAKMRVINNMVPFGAIHDSTRLPTITCCWVA